MKTEFERELRENILPFWTDMIREDGSFPGRVDIDGLVDESAPIGSVMAFRILWMFSAAARRAGNVQAGVMADKVYGYVSSTFVDRKNGGVFWSVSPTGEVLSGKKQSYAIGFAIYALSEYALLRQSSEAEVLAMMMFRALEDNAWDDEHKGYIEALAEDWNGLDDVRLSDKDMNAVFTMNTHLHILEPYTNLYVLTSDSDVREAILRLLDIFRDRIYDSESSHLGSFFNSSWDRLDKEISYGHDIEASWLICEAADAICCTDVSYRELADTLVRACGEGFREDGSLIYKYDSGEWDEERHWWVQAEAVVGLMKMYRRTEDEEWLDMCRGTWKYIQDRIVDPRGGDWYWSRFPDGSVNKKEDKAGFWKCPYHNGRMCIEIMTELADE